MKNLHDRLHDHFHKPTDNSSTEPKGKGKILKHIVFAHVGVIAVIGIVILYYYFLR